MSSPATSTPAAPGTPPATSTPPYLRTAVQPRMLLILVLLLGAAAVCGRLGVWQLERAELRGQAAVSAEQAELAAEPAVPLAEVLEPQTPMGGELVGHKVAVTGTFEGESLLVAGRSVDGATGYLLLDPLRVGTAGGPGGAEASARADGTGDAVLAVVRGWVPSPQAAVEAGPAPSGTVEVEGYLQSGESAGYADLPAGQVDAVSPAELVNRWGGPIYSAYLVAVEMTPEQDSRVVLLPPPTLPGGGLNLQNLAYALQWWIFGGFALLLWVRLVRDEARAVVDPDEWAEADGV